MKLHTVVDPSVLNETMNIKPKRVYRCENGHLSLRKTVYKVEGKYFCKCGAETKDDSDSDTAHDFLEIAFI